MNEQKAPNGIEWCRIRKPDGSRTRGYTWNVLAGCMHACKWQMPDGNEAQCYAKTVAEGVARASYPQGFEHHYFHPERLDEPLKVKEGAGIFIDSMADLMGHWVEDEQIEKVLETCRKAPQHTFFLLTKNAPRLEKFTFPDNVWVGASSPPDWMFGKRLSRQQQSKMLHRTLKTLSEVKAKVRWISFEPLSWDCSAIVQEYPGALTWAVIGAASNGRIEYPPAESDLLAMLTVLDGQSVPVFYKGNMRTLEITAADWREEFPDTLFKPRGSKPYTAYDTPLLDYDMPWEGYKTSDKISEVSPVVEGDILLDKSPDKSVTKLVNFSDVKEHWNPKTQTWDSPDYVYIGRTNVHYNLPNSPWRNVFRIEVDSREAREFAIEQYRAFIPELIKASPLLNLEDLRGKTLVCWCSPKPCHGDVLVELLYPKNTAQPEPEPAKPAGAVSQPSLFGDDDMKALEKKTSQLALLL